jgi:hypothetical protein
MIQAVLNFENSNFNIVSDLAFRASNFLATVELQETEIEILKYSARYFPLANKYDHRDR